ncbi:hypothetical protein SEA_NERGAL_35 [Mycobacterium Phage Nergal]|nr:hypothetical protein SEA_NERGAL_35 [Mycobacterium Phage Nergal]
MHKTLRPENMTRTELLALARAERLAVEQENLRLRKAQRDAQRLIDANERRLRDLEATIGHLS